MVFSVCRSIRTHLIPNLVLSYFCGLRLCGKIPKDRRYPSYFLTSAGTLGGVASFFTLTTSSSQAITFFIVSVLPLLAFSSSFSHDCSCPLHHF